MKYWTWRDVKPGEVLWYLPTGKYHKILNIEQPSHWTSKNCFLITYEDDGVVKQHTPETWCYQRRTPNMITKALWRGL